jgi:glycosyltransferase involved in cell wall biosynthesis
MPSLSVCMMVQNAEKTLAIALESLDHVYDELIIVDGGSTEIWNFGIIMKFYYL